MSKSIGGRKITLFNSDECQSLLNLINRIAIIPIDTLLFITQEEKEAYDRLKKGGTFYVPLPKRKKRIKKRKDNMK